MMVRATPRRLWLPALVMLLATVSYGGTAHAQVQPGVYVTAAENFDLQTVMSLVNPAAGRGVRDLTELETIINDPLSGINDVDIDGDGLVDYIGCVEVRTGGQWSIDFVAYPSSNPSAQPLVIASITFITNQYQRYVELRGAYPYYVYGYEHWYFTDTFYFYQGYARRPFLRWWLSARPIYRPIYYGRNPYYYHHHGRRYYQARRVAGRVIIRSRRQAYHGRRGIRVVRPRARPPGYRVPSAGRHRPQTIRRYGRPGSHYGHHRPAPHVSPPPRRVQPPPRRPHRAPPPRIAPRPRRPHRAPPPPSAPLPQTRRRQRRRGNHRPAQPPRGQRGARPPH